MSLNNPKLHHTFVPEYQGSSFPYVTGSTIAATNDVHEITFPGVTRWIVIHNSEAGGSAKTIKFGFTENGVNAVETENCFVLHSGEITPRLELKCRKLFIGANHTNTNYSVIAGYTGIENFPILTGSNGFDGVG
mgnify:CR=1 FL=1|jgi:hypothetical protein